MKKIAKILALALLSAAFALSSCSNDIDSASTTAGIDSSADDSAALSDNDGKSDKTARKDLSGGSSGGVIDFGDGFVRGFDASAVDYIENEKGNVTTGGWTDSDGEKKDIFKILAAHGVNTIRLRIWNNPTMPGDSDDDEEKNYNGNNTLERTVAMAKRIKGYGFKFMLDFHYSDTWTAPDHQVVPSDWLSLGSSDAVAEALSEYTSEVLSAIKEQAGVVPDYVQIGNEINNGMLTDKSTSGDDDFEYAGTNKSDNLKKYFSAGCEAVRAFDKDIKIVLHVTSSNNPGIVLNTLKDCDYDIIGLSYYPWEQNHGTISDMKSNISSWKTTYGKEVMIAETSAYGDEAANSNDKAKVNLKRAKDYLVDPSGSSVYTDINLDADSTYVLSSVANQKAIVSHVFKEAKDAGATGVFYWGGERNGEWPHGLFNWGGTAFSSISLFSTDVTTTESDSDSDDTGGGTTEAVYDEMTFTLTFTENSAASKVELLYYPSEGSADSGETLTENVSDNSVSFTLSKKYSSGWGFNGTIKVYDSSNSDITSNVTIATPSDCGTCSKWWFKFEKDTTVTVACTVSTGGGVTKTICDKQEFSATESYTQVLTSDKFDGLSIASLKIVVTLSEANEWWASASSASSWADSTYSKLDWSANDNGYSATITSEGFISALSKNGLYIETKNGEKTVKGTITVTYTE